MIGPGTLMGLAWGQRQNDRDFQRERSSLMQELQTAEAVAIGKRAAKDSARAVLNAIVGELALEERGAGPRNLSAPANVAGRNVAFADTAEGQLRRLSNGQLQYDAYALKRIRESQKELVQALGESELRLR